MMKKRMPAILLAGAMAVCMAGSLAGWAKEPEFETVATGESEFETMATGGSESETLVTEEPEEAEPEIETMAMADLEASEPEIETMSMENLEMRELEIPEEIRDGRKIVRLVLPDNETFDDRNWGLVSIQLNREALDCLREAIPEICNQVTEDASNYDKAVDIIQMILNNLRLRDEQIEVDLDLTQIKSVDTFLRTTYEALRTVLGKMVTLNMSWELEDAGEIVLTLKENPTLYFLVNYTVPDMKVNGLAVLIGDRWYDLEVPAEKAAEIRRIIEADGGTDYLGLARTIGESAFEAAFTVKELTSFFFNDSNEVRTGMYLPTEGLENIRLHNVI